MPHIGKRLIQVITDKSLDQHPIFFHVFSNGGAFLYQHVSLAMQQANSPLKVKNTVTFHLSNILYIIASHNIH